MPSKSSTPTDSESDDEEDQPRQTNGGLPPDSEEENEESSHQKKKKSKRLKKLAHAEADTDLQDNVAVEKEKTLQEIKPKNKPFECCIKQYGIKVAEEDPEKADAGEGKRWQRVFGLWGTLIN